MTGPTVPVSGPEDGARCSGRCAKGNHYDCSGHLGCYCECHTEPIAADTTAGEAEDAVRLIAVRYRDPDIARFAINDYRDWVAARSGGAQDDGLRRVLDELAIERQRQTAKHGDQSHLPDGTGPEEWMSLVDLPTWTGAMRAEFADVAEWAKRRCKAASQNEGGDGSITFEHILTEEWAEAIAESDPARLRAELIQVAAVAVQWVQAIDARRALAGPDDARQDGAR